MDFLAQHRTGASHRRGSALLLAAIVAALTMAMAAPASASASGAMAWGANEQGQLGNGTTTSSDMPVAVSGLVSGVNAISAGSLHNLALLGNGTIMSWGENEYGELGDGTRTGPEICGSSPCSKTPVAVSGLSGVTAISAGGGFSLALLSDGTVMAWGHNFAGALGNGSGTGPEACPSGPGTTPCSKTPAAVIGLRGVTAISADGPHSLALLSNGTVMAWGDNEYGQLGDGTHTGPERCPSAGFSTVPCSATPVPVSGLSGVTAISAGDDHNLALLSNGTVMAWGANNDGQLGNGTTTNSDVPVPVSGLSGVSAISGGGFHSLALLNNGTAMAWGDNGNGQLGDATIINRSVPVAVTGLSGVSAISAGLAHSLALLSNATVMAWGWNENGQLGNGSPKGESTVPVPVIGLSGVSAISAGGYHSLSYSPPPPAVTAISPKEGPQSGGTSVSVTGTDFSGATAVKFGSANATSFTVNSGGSITAVSPAGTGTVDVTVTTPAGTSATNAADRFSYVMPATVVTEAASSVTQTSATLNASVNPNGGAVSECRFEYGTMTSYGQSAPCTPAPGSGTSPVAVSAALESLAEGTTYHFRISATNAGGTSLGSDQTFTTQLMLGPHWYVQGVRLPETTLEGGESIMGWGYLTLENAKVGAFTCETLVGGDIANPVGGGAGKGIFDALSFYDCAAPTCEAAKGLLEVIPEKLRWGSVLIEEAGPWRVFRDRIEGIVLRAICVGGESNVEFHGSLKPELEAGSTKGSAPAHLAFGSGSGSLQSSEGAGNVSAKLNFMGFGGEEFLAARQK